MPTWCLTNQPKNYHRKDANKWQHNSQVLMARNRRHDRQRNRSKFGLDRRVFDCADQFGEINIH